MAPDINHVTQSQKDKLGRGRCKANKHVKPRQMCGRKATWQRICTPGRLDAAFDPSSTQSDTVARVEALKQTGNIPGHTASPWARRPLSTSQKPREPWRCLSCCTLSPRYYPRRTRCTSRSETHDVLPTKLVSPNYACITDQLRRHGLKFPAGR